MTTVNVEPEAVPSDRRSPRARRRRRAYLIALLFMAPALIVNLIVIGGPGVSSFYYALTDWNGISAPDFTGLANLYRLLGDQAFWGALIHNAIYLAIFLTVPLIMGLAGAFMLSRVRHGANFFRVVFFIPYLTASVVNALIWKNLLDPSAGLASALDKIGIHWLDNVYFFGDARISLFSVAFVDNWHFWGFLVVLFLAAMQGVDPSRYEAARLDGANAWQEFWHVCLPGIRPTLTFAFMIISLWSLLGFDYPYVLTDGGPGGSSNLVALLVNQTAFQGLQAGYAAFIALTMSILGAIFLVVFAIIRRNEDETA